MNEVRRVNFIKLWFRSRQMANDSGIPQYVLSRRTPHVLLGKSIFRVNDKPVRLRLIYLVLGSRAPFELVIHDSRFDTIEVTLKELLGGEVQASSGTDPNSWEELCKQNWTDLQFSPTVLTLDGKTLSALSYEFGNRRGVGATLESGTQILLIGPAGKKWTTKVETRLN